MSGIYSDISALFKYLPERLSRLVASMPEKIAKEATEIRLRLGSAFSVTVGSRSVSFNAQGKICPVSGGIKCTKQDIDECVSILSQHSLYSYEETIKRGFLPLADGGRAGICGKAVSSPSGIITFSEITSVNLRIHRLYRNFASPLIDLYRRNGLDGALVFSPPGLGKTSLLRSAAVLLSSTESGLEYKTAIVDERSEIFMQEMCGGLIDVVSGCSKAEGIELVTRTMSPQVIICDELAQSDCEPLINAQNSGVALIASAHGSTLENILRRPFIKQMFDCGIFGYAVRISEGFKVSIERI